MIQILFIFCVLYPAPLNKGRMYGHRTPLENKIDPRCYVDDHVRAWVYFTDKGVNTDDYDKVLQVVRKKMGRLAYERRLKRGGTIDFNDIPLHKDYISGVENRGGLLITESKWLNAASFWIAQEDLNDIAHLDFVYKITKVASFKGPQDTETALLDTAHFGLTYDQLHMFNIDSLHSQGFFGSNIKIGILDTGLRRTHTALDNVMVIAEHDFLEGDRVYIENLPITEEFGVYTDIVFHKTDSRLNMFVTGDTIAFSVFPVRDVLYTYSTDGGSEWQPLRRITDNFNNWARELTVCGRDTIFIVYRDRYGLRYSAYDSGIDSVLVDQSVSPFASGYEPSAVLIGDTVYVSYQKKQYLYLNKGTISGFISEVLIDSATSPIKRPKIVSNSNNIGIFYHNFPEDSLYFLKSSIPVSSFSKSFIGIGEDAEAVSYADTIVLIWKDRSNAPSVRIAFSKFSHFGDSLRQHIYLSDDLNSIGKITLAKFNQTITVMWESEGKIYFRNSFDNGGSFNTLDSLDREFVYLPTLGTNNSTILKFYCTRGDSLTDGYFPNDPEYYYPRHGTEMVGLIGGYLRNSYVGVAPAVQFIIAKTENPDSAYEFIVEEDLWVTGLEWCEANGADIITSSLGYGEWYTWPSDFDGKTSPASIAATQATERGMIVVSAAGNVSIPRIVIPGDAERVITVGGIDTLFNRWEFSGYFPTADHSPKKPEIMCLSAAPIVVDPDSTNSYLYSFGTSGATAMVSGICALLLEGHPDWDVDSVRTALFTTASHANTPTDSMGYGWPDAFAAFYSSQPIGDTLPGPRFMTPYPNPFILSQYETIIIPFELDKSYTIDIKIYSITGRLIKNFSLSPFDLTLPTQVVWDGTNNTGNRVAEGVYFIRFESNNFCKVKKVVLVR